MSHRLWLALILCFQVGAQSTSPARTRPLDEASKAAEIVGKVYQHKGAGEWEKAAQLTYPGDLERLKKGIEPTPESLKLFKVRTRAELDALDPQTAYARRMADTQGSEALKEYQAVRVLGAALLSPEMAFVVSRTHRNGLGDEQIVLDVAQKVGGQWKYVLFPAIKRGDGRSTLSDTRASAAAAMMERFMKNDWAGLPTVMHPAAMERFKNEMRVFCDIPMGGGLKCRELFEVSDLKSYDELPAPNVVTRFFQHDLRTGRSASGYRDLAIHGVVPESSDVAHVLITFLADNELSPDVVTVRRTSGGKWLADSRLFVDRNTYTDRSTIVEISNQRRSVIKERDESLERRTEELRKLYEEQQRQSSGQKKVP